MMCRLARTGFELGSPDYQEKVFSTSLVRDHKFIIIWAKLYVAVCHIGPPNFENRVSKNDEIVTALKGRVP
jgi:hypothetical protein